MILTVGLELGLITDTIFTIGVLMALVTTFMATPLLRLLLPRDRRGADLGDDVSRRPVRRSPRAVDATADVGPRSGWDVHARP